MPTLPDPAEWRHDPPPAATAGTPQRVDRVPATLRYARREDDDRADDLRRLLGDIAALVAGVTLATRELRRVTGRLRGAAVDLGDAVGDALDVAREHGGGALRATERALASRPYVAIGLAAALVVGLGIAVSRRRRDHGVHDEYDGWDHFV